MRDTSTSFDAHYYETGLGLPYKRDDHWLNAFGFIADEVIRSLRPRTAFDAGCAMGMLVESLWDRGVATHGIDISSYAISQVRRDIQPYCRVASLVNPIDGSYDLVICIEVLEHLQPEETEAAIANLAAAGDTILFSSSPTDLAEPTHWNVRPLINWLKLFANVGFWPDCVFDASFVAPHAILLRKQPDLPDDILVLFGEKTRLKCALVEREQRIGGLNQKVADLTASAAEDLQLREKNIQLLGELNELREEKIQLLGELNELRGQYAGILNELAELRDKEDRLSRERLTLVPETQLAQMRMAKVKSEAEAEIVRREAAGYRAALNLAKHELVCIRVQEELTPLRTLASRTLKEIWASMTLRRSEQLRERRELMRSVETVGSSPFFDPSWYLENYPDVAAAGLDPLLHYIEHGAAEGRNPGPKFDAKWYLDQNPDVSASGMSPLAHYLEFGAKEGREIRPVAPVSDNGNSNLVRRSELIAASSFFDPNWYVENYPDIAAEGLDPLLHYLEHGAAEGRNPGPKFDAKWYLDRNPDVSEAGKSPLVHYLKFGVKEGREIRPVVPVSDNGNSNLVRRSELVSASYESWIARTEPEPKVLELQRVLCRNLRLQPLISVVVPVHLVPLRVLQDTVDSVLCQTYHNWELCISHDYPLDVDSREYLASIAAQNERVKLTLLDASIGISANSNAALELVNGEFIALLDHDDVLAPFALFQMVSTINEHPDAGFFYSDKDCITENGRERLRPLLKPQWCPDTMLSANYLTHLCVMRTDVVRALGGFRRETDGAQDWDLFLRIADAGAKIVHVPGVLYHWRIISTSVASGGVKAKPYVTSAQIRTVNEHAERRGLRAKATIDSSGRFKMDWSGAEECPTSVILVSSSLDPHSIEKWARHVDSFTEWPQVEFIAPGANNSEAHGRVRSTPRNPDDSIATYLNRAVQESRGEHLVFLDDSVEVCTPDWLKELTGPLEIPEIAIIGAKLLDPLDSKLRHAGLVFNPDGTVDYIFSHEPEHIYEQFGTPVWCRNWSAIAGACFAIRREAFERAGAFRENPDYPRHDVDLCLRVGLEAGERILYNPFARFFQEQSSVLETWLSSDGPQRGSAYIRECFPAGDPYFHRELDSRSGEVRFASNKTDAIAIDYAAQSRALVGAFDTDSALIDASKERTRGQKTNSLRRLTWVLPQFEHPFYGGVHTILRFADHFSRSQGVESDFVYLGTVPEQVMRSRLSKAFPELAARSEITHLRAYADWDRVRMSDATISTLWTTAYAALHFRNTRGKFYFVQDYESTFYPAGSTYALVEATYRFGYYAICNTRSLKEMYREFGGEAEYFDPCIDPQYFFEPAQDRDESRPFRLFCYTRPGHPRNCFELLTAALQKLKKRMGDEVEILSAGSEWDPADYGLTGVVENLGLLGYSATGALYRTCHAGVVLMMTRHPSYLPMELMACGSLLITNENRYTRWLLDHENNCLLTDTSASTVAEAIERGLTDKCLRDSIKREAADQIRAHYSDWAGQAEKIYQYMVASI